MSFIDLLLKANTITAGLAALTVMVAAPFVLTDNSFIALESSEEGVVAGAYAELEEPILHTPTPTPTPIPVDQPVRIEIPSLGIDTSVVEVGVTADNVMEVPAEFSQVGWFTQGVRPGESGEHAAIMSGHYDNTDGSPAIFFSLEEIATGEEVIVTDTSGRRFAFVVEGVVSHPLEDFPTDIVYGQVERPSLKLITCDGVWHTGSRSYTDRLVVTTKLVRIALPAEPAGML